MEKLNKSKVILIIILALVVVTAIILGIIFLKGGDEGDTTAQSGTISKTESEFEPLKVQDIVLNYVEEKNTTTIDFAIENTTNEKVEKLDIDIQLLNENEQVIASVETYVETIDANSKHKVNMMLLGNIQGIKKIKLVKPEEETTPAE